MKVTVICDHKLTMQDNKFYISSGPYERSIKRYLNVFDRLDYICRSTEIDVIEEKLHINDENVRVIPINYSLKDHKLIREIHKIESKMEKEVEKTDVCIIHLPSILGLFAVRECNKQNKPYLIEVVGSVWDVYWNHSIKGKFVAPIMTLFTKIAVKNAKYVLYVTEKFLQNKLPTKGATIACSDVSLPYLSDDILIKRIEKINRLNRASTIVIGTTAAVDVRYKGQEDIIIAISKLKEEGYNFEYHLAGGGDNSYLKSVAEKYNINDRVKFLKYITHDKIFEYLDDVDIYVQPSKTEGLPRALVEAMSRGCPCIGSNVGGIPELINPDLTFEYSNVKMICNLLKKIDKEMMIEDAKRNFNKSKQFDKSSLDQKRNKFFRLFREEVRKL